MRLVPAASSFMAHLGVVEIRRRKTAIHEGGTIILRSGNQALLKQSSVFHSSVQDMGGGTATAPPMWTISARRTDRPAPTGRSEAAAGVPLGARTPCQDAPSMRI